MLLQNIISQGSSVFLNDISSVVDTLEVGVDVTSPSIYWFTPYRASDFPELNCNKTYFFLWSTDHDTGDGGIYCGKGNNLDLSDFEEVGLWFDGDQAETPFLYRFPDADRPVFLYYHTLGGNCFGQNTRLRTTSGGDLDSLSWTQETDPITCQGTVSGVTQNHTGYLRFWDLGNGLIGNHHFNGTSPLTFQRCTITDGLNPFGNLDIYTQYNPFLEAGRSYVLSWGTYFKKGDNYYGIVNSHDDTYSFDGGTSPSGKLHVVRVNSDLEITELIATLNNNEEIQGFSIFIDGNTAHLYRQTGRASRPLTFYDFLGYSTLDISEL